jgi:hypothetical protein
MARKDKLGKASETASVAARAVQSNQYLQRLIEDEELRSSLIGAYESARNAYGRASNGKPISALLDDHKLQKEIKEAASSLMDASGSLREPAKSKRRRKGGGIARTLFLLTVSAGLAVAFSEGLRAKVLDMLFGAEEEFDYSSTTTPATPAPEAVAGG